MASQTRTAGTVDLTNTGWTAIGGNSVTVIEAADSAYEALTLPVAAPNTGYLTVKNFGFSLPGSAANIQVFFYWSAKRVGGAFNIYGSLTKDGSTADEWQGPVALLTTYSSTGFGPLTGYSISDLNSSNFGAIFRCATSGTVNLDHVYVTVTYDEGATNQYTYPGTMGVTLGMTSSYAFASYPANNNSYSGTMGVTLGLSGTYSFTPQIQEHRELIMRHREKSVGVCAISGITFPMSRMKRDGFGRLVGDIYYRENG